MSSEHTFGFCSSTDMFSDLSAQKQGSSLLCRPDSEQQGPVFDRTSLAYSRCSDLYKVGDRSFSRQYAHIYSARLMQMRPLLSERAQQKWGKCSEQSASARTESTTFSVMCRFAQT